jgi:hypothetical protein
MSDYDTDEKIDYGKIIGILPEECTRVPFWTENPNVLFQSHYILEFFPVESMSYEQKLNAVSRLVILLTIIGFILTRSVRLLIISAITLFSIHLLHYYQQNEKDKKEFKKNDLEKNGIAEPFENPALDLLKKEGVPISDDVFMKPNSTNPFSNVLMNDYDYNPQKKPAPPIAKSAVSASILDEAKQLVKSLNPDQPDIADKLFKDLGEQYTFEQSLRPFYSTANTTIPNDQDGFAKFCYGSMISCKEGNQFACARNLSRHVNN